MKQLVMTLAAALFATALMAEVVSGNVVGYNTVTLKQGFNMLACNFDQVGIGTNTLDKVIPGTLTGLVAGNNVGTADNIMVFDPTPGVQSYTTYFLWYTTKAALQTYNYKWVLNSATPAGVALKSGDAFWYRSKSTTNIAINVACAGEVPTVNKDITIRPGFNMIAGNYSADWSPNDKGAAFWQTSGAVAGNNVGTADNIMVFDPTPGVQSYTTYFLWYTTKAALQTYNYNWVINSATPAPTNFVKLGQGVWYRAKMPSGSFVIPVTAPYSL